LTTTTASGSYYAWQERSSGPFLLSRVDRHGTEYGPVEVPDFVTARVVVTCVQAALEGRALSDARLRALVMAHHRRANPGSDDFNPDLRREYIARGGVAAFFGAIAGTLIGSTPGIILGNAPVTTVGSHIGSIMGAAAGAYLGSRRRSNPDRVPYSTAHPEPVHAIKKRLLRT
jgi:hypothetical protein